MTEATGQGANARAKTPQFDTKQFAVNSGMVLLDAGVTYSKLKAQKQALKAQAQQARQNATLADIQSRNAIEDSRNQIGDYQRGVQQFKSSQINALAENGFDVTQGSAIDLLASTEVLAQADIDNMRYNAALQAWGYQVEKTNYINEANALDAQAKAVRPSFNTFMSFSAGLNQAASKAASSGAG